MVSILALSAVVAAWNFQLHSREKLLQARHQTREARVRLQQTEQQLYRLVNDSSNPLLSVLGEDVTFLQIRVAEFLKRSTVVPDDNNEQSENSNYQLKDNVSDTTGAASQTRAFVVAYEQSLLTDPLYRSEEEGDAAGYAQVVRVLRLDLQVQTAHAPQLLDFLEKLNTVAKGWPLEVRACELHRSVRTGLDARCVVDVYHWAIDDTKVSESRSL